MTTLLQHAFAEAAKLPAEEQEMLASRILAEIVAEDDFDRKIARTSHLLSGLAEEALAEFHAGNTTGHDQDES